MSISEIAGGSPDGAPSPAAKVSGCRVTTSLPVPVIKVRN
jgi:hypothetical protein